MVSKDTEFDVAAIERRIPVSPLEYAQNVVDNSMHAHRNDKIEY
jgi:hypothetical protein